MANVVVTLKIMPTGPDVNLEEVAVKAKKKVVNFVDEAHKDSEMKTELQDVAFGIKELRLTFVMDESKGDTESLEKDIASLEEVESVEAVDVRRAIG